MVPREHVVLGADGGMGIKPNGVTQAECVAFGRDGDVSVWVL